MANGRLHACWIPVAAGVLSIAGGRVGAQTAEPREDERRILPRDLRPVEQRRTDVNPLVGPGRSAPVFLGEPNDFRTVYQIPADASQRYGGWFARVRGGVIAAFPRSVYKWVQTPDGKSMVNLPFAPAGTVYFLGGIPRSFLDDPSRAEPHDGAIDTRVSAGALSTQIETAAQEPPAAKRDEPGRTIDSGGDSKESLRRLSEATLRLFTDESHRQRRIDALLSGAARSEPAKPRGQDSSVPEAKRPTEPDGPHNAPTAKPSPAAP
ncbi:MAG: hypothetical protein JNJ48_04130 [Phycisphaerae bacterium]|nr:hypothetical protein [Phycisphaerae bacterium]